MDRIAPPGPFATRPFFSVRLLSVTSPELTVKMRDFCCASMLVVDDPLPVIVTVSLISICPSVRSNSTLFVDAAKVIEFTPGLLFASTIASRSDKSPELILPSSSSVVVLTTSGVEIVKSSYAPISTVEFAIRATGLPRWSVVSPFSDVLLPRSMAGLPVSNACVCVGPPLNASGPSCGLIAVLLPIKLPLVSGVAEACRLVSVLTPTRLLEMVGVVPRKSVGVPLVCLLPAMILFRMISC